MNESYRVIIRMLYKNAFKKDKKISSTSLWCFKPLDEDEHVVYLLLADFHNSMKTRMKDGFR